MKLQTDEQDKIENGEKNPPAFRLVQHPAVAYNRQVLCAADARSQYPERRFVKAYISRHSISNQCPGRSVPAFFEPGL
jgi:hypothetical protein